MTRHLHADRPADLAAAAGILRAGGLVALPTETVYGLAGNALDERAVAGIFAAKGRPAFDPLIVHVPTLAHAEKLAQFGDAERKLAEAFWPGPLTLVVERKPTGGIGDLVTAGLPHVGIRIPAKHAALELLRDCGLPLAAPSANRFGSISPTDAAHVMMELDGRIAAVLDAGPCERGIESTVVKFEDGKPVVLRLGALSVAAIARALGLAEAQVEVRRGTSKPGEALPAPGMTDRHYAPRTPMRLLAPGTTGLQARGSAGLLAFSQSRTGFQSVEVLSPAGDSVEAAANLFAAMRTLDAAGCDEIWAELAPEDAPGGLGPAINDRLRRAAG